MTLFTTRAAAAKLRLSRAKLPGRAGAAPGRSLLHGREAELAQFLPQARREVAPAEGDSEVGREKAQARAAVVGAPVEAHAVELLRAGELDHAVGQLNLAARPLLDQFEDLEDFRLQDVSPRDDAVGRRFARLRLLHHAGDLERVPVVGADRDDAVLMGLVG